MRDANRKRRAAHKHAKHFKKLTYGRLEVVSVKIWRHDFAYASLQAAIVYTTNCTMVRNHLINITDGTSIVSKPVSVSYRV